MSVLNRFQQKWQLLSSKQRFTISILLFLLITLPMAVVLALNEVNLRSEAASNPVPAATIFEDDFSTDKGWWLVPNSESENEISIVNEELEIAAVPTDNEGKTAQVLAPIDTTAITEDYLMGVDARLVEAGRAVGLVFNYLDKDHFFIFMIKPKIKEYNLYLFGNDGWERLARGNSEAILADQATNRLQIRHFGDAAEAFVNGVLVASVSDNQLGRSQSGRIGIYLDTPDDAVGQVSIARFDNFKVVDLIDPGSPPVPTLTPTPTSQWPPVNSPTPPFTAPGAKCSWTRKSARFCRGKEVYEIVRGGMCVATGEQDKWGEEICRWKRE